MNNESFKREQKSRTIPYEKLETIKGFDITTKNITVKDILHYYKNIGFQASNLARATEIIQQMKKEKVDIYLTATSNMGSSGLREIIAQLIQHKLIKALITTTGLIEEDIMKTKHSFKLGKFDANDTEIKKNKLNRIGNIFVPDDHYCWLEDFHNAFIKKNMKDKKIWSPSEYTRALGLGLNDEKSILYWATKNNIPIFSPGFVDGALGDHIFFHNENKKENEKIIIDTAKDLTLFYKMILDSPKTGGVFLGGGTPKHHLIGAAILRNGLDYAIYIQTGTQYDGSLSGAHPKEAISWNKLKKEENSTIIETEATLIFPLLAIEWMN